MLVTVARRPDAALVRAELRAEGVGGGRVAPDPGPGPEVVSLGNTRRLLLLLLL